MEKAERDAILLEAVTAFHEALRDVLPELSVFSPEGSSIHAIAQSYRNYINQARVEERNQAVWDCRKILADKLGAVLEFDLEESPTFDWVAQRAWNKIMDSQQRVKYLEQGLANRDAVDQHAAILLECAAEQHMGSHAEWKGVLKMVGAYLRRHVRATNVTPPPVDPDGIPF